jgi:hypothetical protein
VDAVVASVIETEPDPVTEAGLKEAVVPAGRPLALKFTVPAKSEMGATVTV